MTPEVTVVIPTRNRRALLAESVASILRQTLQNWELLVVDDASTDDTVQWLASLCDPRLRMLRMETHRERSAARNLGLAEARADLIVFLDDDDLLREHALERLAASMREYPEAVAASGPCRILQGNGDSVKVYRPASMHAGIIWRELLFGWWAGSGQVMYRTSVLRKIGGYHSEVIPCEDRKLWLQIARSGVAVTIPQVVMDYRLHAGQSKPADLQQIRERVWDEFIATLPPRQQREARRIRRSAVRTQNSVDARAAGDFSRALRSQIAAMWLSPSLLRSPLTARPMWWELKKGLLRSREP